MVMVVKRMAICSLFRFVRASLSVYAFLRGLWRQVGSDSTPPSVPVPDIYLASIVGQPRPSHPQANGDLDHTTEVMSTL